MKARGFSLLECLIGLGLSFLVVCACLQFFIAAEMSYFKLRDREERSQSALAAMDKMRVDILRAGQGLASEAALGLVEPAVESSGVLLLTRAERDYVLAADVASGDSQILLASVAELKAGREVIVSDGVNGEVLVISAVAPGAVGVAPPVSRPYKKEKALFRLLETVSLALDARQGVIRRRTNGSAAQPLLENVGAAGFVVDREANLVRVRFSLTSQGDATYELCLFPKNPALARKG